MVPLGGSLPCGGAPIAEAEQAPPGEVVAAYVAGVDRTLIVKNLGLTVEERFIQLMELQRFAAELERAGREARGR